MIVGSTGQCNPPDIERILDTIVTKNNERYYKVKWVKVAWEAETDLAHFGDVIDRFWDENTQENLLINCPTDHEHNSSQPQSTEDFTVASKCDTEGITSTNLLDLPFTSVNTQLNKNLDNVEGCSEAISTSQSISSIEVNKELKSTDGNYHCKFCIQIFKKESSYQRHLLTHQLKKCPFCKKEFNRIGHLETHILTHGNIRPYTCPECDKSFTDKSTLLKHKLTHTNLRQHKCNLCEWSFQRAEHLHRHKLSKHENIRNYQCDICKKAFHLKHTLKTHMNTHTGMKPYLCNVCTKSFNDRSTLSKHLVIHTDAKPHKCIECSKSFNRSYSLKRHVQNFHRVNTNTQTMGQTSFSTRSTNTFDKL